MDIVNDINRANRLFALTLSYLLCHTYENGELSLPLKARVIDAKNIN